MTTFSNNPLPDPVRRRKSSCRTPPPLARDLAHAQLERRTRALQAQSERRQHAFMAARAGVGASTIEEMDNLSISMDSDSDASDSEPTPTPNATVEPVISKTKRKAYKPKYHAWAKNLLQYAETLLLDTLPSNLETEWSCAVVPRGKRSLCSVGTMNHGTNTTLLSRVAGRTLARRETVLPPDSLLDCIWDDDLSILWVLDIVRWRGVWYVEHDTNFRTFFLSSKLSELPLQPYLPPLSPTSTPSSPPLKPSQRPLLVLPIPTKLPPLSSATLLSLTEHISQTSLLPHTVLLPLPTLVQIPFNPTGLLFYLLDAKYESGQTALSGWVPLEPEEGKEGREGVTRLRELLLEKAESDSKPLDDDEMES